MMSKEKRRVPKLRFPGFTEDWEQREFSDIFSEVKSGLSRMLSNDDIGLPVVRANNINDGQLNLVDDIKYWYKNDPQGANTNNYLIEQGDILINFINSEAKMGTAAYVTRRPERDTIYTTNILRCKVNDEYNPYFIYSLTFLNSYKNYIASITKPAVNQASFTTVDFKKYSIKIPTVKEQNQIADLIETFNKLITLHQRKLDNLKLKKKALLQKLFPKNGERYPELRFPGFTDAWEQRKLGEYANFRRGSFPQPYGNKEWYDGVDSAPFVQVVDVGDNLSLVECTKQRISKLAQPMSVYAEKGSVLVTLQGSIGRVAVSQYDAFIDRTILIFQGYKYKTNSYFWAYIIKNKFFEEALKAPGGTIKTITKEVLSNFIILYPKFSEQEQIGSFFEKLDKLITLHQRKLDHLQLQKKALLQQMFV